MKTTLATAALGLTLIANTGFAAEGAPTTAYSTGTRIRVGELLLPKCRTESGKNATYVVTNSPRLQIPFAYSITRKGQPAPITEGIPQERGHYIVIPKKFMAQADQDTAIFAIAHECAHQELGHTVMLNEGVDRTLGQTFEREADCLAPAIIMQDYGMNAVRAAQIIARTFTSNFFQKNERERHADTAVHDSSRQRLANTMACLRAQTSELTQ